MKSLLGPILAICLAGVLGGCNETLAPFQANAPASAANTRESFAITPRPGVSPAGAPVAFISLSGAPEAISGAYASALAQALAQNSVATQEAASAPYLLRAHLSGQPAEGGGVVIAFVWDIYGADRQRRHRLSDEMTIKQATGDPWSAANEQVLAALAARGARELAAYLTHTPEAIAAAANPAAVATAGAPTAPATAPTVQAAASTPLAFGPAR